MQLSLLVLRSLHKTKQFLGVRASNPEIMEAPYRIAGEANFDAFTALDCVDIAVAHPFAIDSNLHQLQCEGS